MGNYHMVQSRILLHVRQLLSLTWLTKPMVQYHLQKLNQAGKATNSLVQLPASMTLNDSQLLAGHTSFISTLTKNSPQLTKCKRDLLNQKERRRAAFAVEKGYFVDLVSETWDKSFAHFTTNQNAITEQGWVH